MNSVPVLLAWRYIRGTGEEQTIATMMKVCFVGILIGSCALALVLSVMNGFEKITHEKMQGIHAQLIVRSYNGAHLDAKKLGSVLKKEFPEVAAFSPSTTQHLLIYNEETDDAPDVVMIKAIDPDKEQNVSSLEKKILWSREKKTLPATLANNKILIGKKLAKYLEVKSGSTIQLLFFPNEHVSRRTIKLNKKNAVVGGIFSTGIDEYDSNVVFCAMPLLSKLFPDAGITQVNLRLAPHTHEATLIAKLQKRFRLDVRSWKSLYPALVSALKLEKYAMFFILSLIILVASMNIISLLFMIITQKRGDIAILKAMGCPDEHITAIFVGIGMGIACLASIAGLISAWLIGLFLQTYKFITLPDAYYVTHLPVRMEWYLFLLVFFVIMVLSFFATWLPARSTRKINIANVLRFEA